MLGFVYYDRVTKSARKSNIHACLECFFITCDIALYNTVIANSVCKSLPKMVKTMIGWTFKMKFQFVFFLIN